MKKTALISVFNKKGIVDFANQLKELGWDIIASGGTFKTLTEAGIKAKDVASIVGGKAILGHRVVTLSREVHAGLLARDIDEDHQELKQLGIPWIGLVCVDLYPLKEEINNPKATTESVIEKTDIGGPTLLRSAAKGQRIVVCDPNDRQLVIDWLKQEEPNRNEFITQLAAKAEKVVADYCLTSARFHSQGNNEGVIAEKVLTCKYGENAWQTPAALFSHGSDDLLALDKFKVIAGTDPSYNNLCDIHRLVQTITHIAAAFDLNRGKIPNIAVGVKHGNACGAAVGSDKNEVIKNMVNGDKRAIFGGLVMTNFEIDQETAQTLISHDMPKGEQRILDGIIAPSFVDGVNSFLERKAGKCRLMENKALGSELGQKSLDSTSAFRYVRGGFLAQPNFTFVLDLNDPDLEKITQATERQENNILLAWAIGSTSNSNTVTLIRDGYLIGNGIGQQDRVGCCKLAVHLRAKDAGHDTNGAVAYSDSFFPFVDGPEVLAEAGIKVILASKGSIRDQEVIDFCKNKGIILYLIPDKKARGFFGH